MQQLHPILGEITLHQPLDDDNPASKVRRKAALPKKTMWFIHTTFPLHVSLSQAPQTVIGCDLNIH